MKIKNCILFAILTLLPILIYGNNMKYIDKIDVSRGLSHNGVTSMIEDSRGYLWIGTYDGLNLYDGNKITIYKNTPQSRLLSSNRIRAIREDKQGHLWLGTESGVTVFDFEHNQFRQLSITIDGKSVDVNTITICEIMYDAQSEEMICFTDRCQVIVYDLDYNLTSYTPIEKPYSYTLNRVVKHRDNTYIMATNRGLYLFDKSNIGQIIPLPNFNKLYKSILKIDNNSFIAITNNKLHYISLNEANEAHLITEFKPIKGVEYNTLFKDSSNRLYIGTLNDGVYRTTINDVKSQDYKFETTGHFRTSGFLESVNTYCWIYTFDRGVLCYSLNNNPFREVPSNTSKRLLSAYAYDANRVIYVEDGVIKLFNTQNDKNEISRSPLPREVKSSSIFIHLSKNNSLLLCAMVNQQQHFYILRNNRFVEVKNLDFCSGNQFMPSYIGEDCKGDIWLCYDNEIFRLRKNTKDEIVAVDDIHRSAALSDYTLGRIRELYFDTASDAVWICTEKCGLVVLHNIYGDNLNEFTVENYIYQQNNPQSISHNFISTALRDNDNILWLGTEGGGLCRVDESDPADLKFRAFTEKDGLSNNVVKSILCDNNGNLWIATNIGLSLLNTTNNTFQIYRQKDGLPFEEFSYNSIRLDNGTLFFKGATSAFVVNPENIQSNSTLPKFQFGEVKINGRTIQPRDTIGGRVLLNHRLINGDTLRLSHTEDSFSIAVTSLHYGDNNNHFIRYKLEPNNQNWIIQNTNQPTINFNALRSGEYTLLVSVSNLNGEWSADKELHIIVAPPFWRTTAAYFIYLTLLILAILAAFRIIMQFQNLRHNLEVETIEKDILKRANDEKHRFFSNTSHELKTPLTIMSAPITSLLDMFEGNREVVRNLQSIERQSRKISQLVDTALTVQLDEYNLLKLATTVFSFNQVIKDSVADFEFVAKRDKKKLFLNDPTGDIFVNADLSMVEKVINNILNNAFKYTRTNDTITIEYYTENDNLILSILDTGMGISPLDLPHIFERYYHGGDIHAPSGTGIGLAFSKRLIELHNGTIDVVSSVEESTKFTVTLPIVTNAVPSTYHQESTESVSSSIILDNLDDMAYRVDNEHRDVTIFLVEDNYDVRQILRELLARRYNIEEFASGEECLEAMKSQWPDLILSDVMMPGISGYELCHKIKTDINTSHIPIILITACSGVEDRIAGLQSGADAYIPKPFYPKHVIVRIETLLENRQRLRERYKIGIPITMIGANEDRTKDNEFMKRLYDKVDALLDQEIDLADLAIELGMNRTYLFKKVKALTDKTPSEFIKEFRLVRASELLLTKKYSILEICTMIGIKSRSNFGKLFKERFGVTPSQYVDMNSGENK